MAVTLSRSSANVESASASCPDDRDGELYSFTGLTISLVSSEMLVARADLRRPLRTPSVRRFNVPVE
jgi:hypothetical protein